MATEIFVNLPVKDLNKTVAFFTALGFSFNPQFTDEKATCMIVGDNIFVMLLVEEFFKTFIQKEISDATKSTEVIIAISTDSKEKVDDMVDKVIKAGGQSPKPPQDYGWMYYRQFEDINGHLWEIMYTDKEAMQKQFGG
jgi:predicted lactoylglutathione lyase